MQFLTDKCDSDNKDNSETSKISFFLYLMERSLKMQVFPIWQFTQVVYILPGG